MRAHATEVQGDFLKELSQVFGRLQAVRDARNERRKREQCRMKTEGEGNAAHALD